jgi:hypothetical protein
MAGSAVGTVVEDFLPLLARTCGTAWLMGEDERLTAVR